MAAKQVRTRKSIQSLLAVGLFAITFELASVSHTMAFPSLFQRASLFRRHQQQQQQQQEKPRQPKQLVPIANNYSPQLISTGQLGQMHPAAELLRISGMQQAHHQPAQTIGAHQMQPPREQQQHQQQQQQFINPAASFALAQHALPQTGQTGVIYNDDDDTAALISQFDSAPQAAAYYKSSMVRPLASLNGAQHNQQQQPALVQEQSFDMSDNSNYFRDDSAVRQVEQPASRQQAAAPTHTSEIVDKIEQHIEQQIEQGLKKDEKESSASGEHEEHEEHEARKEEEEEKEEKEEKGGGSEKVGEEKHKQQEGQEEKGIYKEHEHKHKPEVHEHQHHEHHSEHHLQAPPEAFEVHHKKGGKSYQYFHQGHSHP